ncbi:MAG: bifunctional diguanylate cyclase/phosphohydrolase [Eubacteriales bacterium]
MKKELTYFNEIKQGQIRIIFFTLKILALFFSAIPLFQYFSIKMSLDFMGSNYNIFTVGTTLLIICSVMFVIMLIFNKKDNNKFLQKLEMFIFFAVFIIVILISGSHESYYKFLFLFIVISYTIEYGMKTGLVIASLSSVVVFIIDVILPNKITVNKNLENDFALFAMFFLVAWTLGYYVRLEKTHIKSLTEFANIDGLTGVYNHRYFHECISNMCEESVKNNTQLSLLIIDIDYFKKYNDIFGHKKGDDLLIIFTDKIKRNLRSNDILCRYGGDEFCVILPDTGKEQAVKIANKLRLMASDAYFEGQEYLPDNNLTISIGLSTFNNKTENYYNLIENADSALYKAKFLRRNKVEVYSSIFEQFVEFDSDDMIENLNQFKTLISVINSRDTYTYKHVERVFNYCILMADYLKLPKKDKKTLMYGAYLHDLGKVNVSKEILVADNKLTDEQWAELKRHPKDSAEIIKDIKGFDDVVRVVLEHHEKYNGSGYPNGIIGENISYLARILTVVDSFDAMTNQRTYQKIKTFDDAFIELERCKGTHFDPVIATKFIEMIQTL